MKSIPATLPPGAKRLSSAYKPMHINHLIPGRTYDKDKGLSNAEPFTVFFESCLRLLVMQTNFPEGVPGDGCFKLFFEPNPKILKPFRILFIITGRTSSCAIAPRNNSRLLLSQPNFPPKPSLKHVKADIG